MIHLDRSKKYNFLLVRCDRIGDVVSSLPCAQSLKSVYKNSKVYFLTHSYTVDLLKNNPFIDGLICIDDHQFDSIKISKKSLFHRIKALKIDISISLFADKRSTINLFLVGIKTRIGNFSKIYSLLFNYKIKQNRSKSIKHEAVYNLELLKSIGCKEIFFPKIYLDIGEKNIATEYLKNKLGYKDSMIIIHPGSRGSGIDWNVNNFLFIANELTSKYKILITGSKSEILLYSKLLSNYENLNENNLMSEEKSLREFLGIISNATLFISNSTGPYHCAVALNIKTIGLFSLKRSISPIRWGAFSPNNIHTMITPIGIYDKTKKIDFNSDDAINMNLIDKKFVLDLINMHLKNIV